MRSPSSWSIRGGDVMVALRANDAGPHTMENARRKAYTARTFKMTSEEFAKRMETEPVRRQQATLPGVIGIPGGLPLRVGDDVIGGVGLSGSPGVVRRSACRPASTRSRTSSNKGPDPDLFASLKPP